MSGLNNRYWRMFDENSNMGEKMSTHVGGAGKDACDDLKKSLKILFQEWDTEWKRLGLKPKRQKRKP